MHDGIEHRVHGELHFGNRGNDDGDAGKQLDVCAMGRTIVRRNNLHGHDGLGAERVSDV